MVKMCVHMKYKKKKEKRDTKMYKCLEIETWPLVFSYLMRCLNHTEVI